MDLKLSERYEDYREAVRVFLEEHRSVWRQPMADSDGRPSAAGRSWQALLIEHGYTCRTIPKQYGGHGGKADILESFIAAEEFHRVGAPTGLANQGISMFVPTLLECGTPEQKERWIRPTISGEIVWCQGYSEPGAGSDLANLQTRAVEDGEDFVVNGQKIWTSSAHFSDMMFVLVRTEPEAPKHHGISYLILSMDTPGIEVRPLKTMTGRAEFNEVFFTDVRLPKTQIVGERGAGWQVANTTLKHERGMLGDPGQANAMLGRVVAIMEEETLDGVRLIEHSGLQDRLLRLQARAQAMKLHGLRLLTHGLKGEDAGVARLIVKLNGTILNHEIAAFAIDVLGELGALYEDSPHLKDRGFWQTTHMFSLGLIIGGGTSQIQKNIISERGLGMPREPKPASKGA
ncbi:MAG: acyl-CoA dehydrogenase [Gammaproteobacteria bacterium]|nr:MAG: acyl-CoA dehydrogenase [Gammaproteobacteria bacterium]